MPPDIIARVRYYDVSAPKRDFYSSVQKDDYLGYIDKGVQSTKAIDYLDYTDDGRGFNPQAMMDCGMGLSNIASRINSLGGTFDIASAKGKGMRAAIRVNTQEEPAPLNRNHNRKRRRR